MASSILTNIGAMTALRTLQTTNANLAQTQDRVSTGKKVATAKDNSASWAIANTMMSNVNALQTVSDSIGAGSAAIGLFRGQAERVADILKDVKAKVIARDDPTNSSKKADIEAEIKTLVDSITYISKSANFNGIKLIGSTASQSFIAAYDGTTANPTTISIAGQDWSSASSIGGTNLSNASSISVENVEDALTNVQKFASTLGATQKQLDIQKTFTNSMIDALKVGVSSLVDADMTEESARLQALQVQQQLGTQALSIANQAPQSLLSLFR